MGNPFRGDDGVGLAVIRRLEEVYKLSEDVQLIQHTGDGIHLINLWETNNKVIIVDAAQGGKRPGAVHRISISETEFPQQLAGYSSHSFGVAEAIALARVIKRLPQQLIVFAVEGTTFDYGASLSPRVEKAVDTLVEQIYKECTSLI